MFLLITKLMKGHQLLLRFGAHLLILILFYAHKLLNKADRHFIAKSTKRVSAVKVICSLDYLRRSRDCSAIVVIIVRPG